MSKLIGFKICDQTYRVSSSDNYFYINSDANNHILCFIYPDDNIFQIKHFKNRKSLEDCIRNILMNHFELPSFLAIEKKKIIYNRKLVFFKFNPLQDFYMYNAIDRTPLFYFNDSLSSEQQSLINSTFDTINTERELLKNIKPLNTENIPKDHILVILSSKESDGSDIENFPMTEFRVVKLKH